MSCRVWDGGGKAQPSQKFWQRGGNTSVEIYEVLSPFYWPYCIDLKLVLGQILKTGATQGGEVHSPHSSIWIFLNSSGGITLHSLIISREVLILTLSIFNALQGCISWYSLSTGLISEDMIHRDHNIQYTPCALGSVRRNTALGTVFPRTLPRASIRNTSSRGKH